MPAQYDRRVPLVATPEFLEAYQRLDHSGLERVDSAIVRLASDPSSAWARQNGVRGEQGSAWLIIVRCQTNDWALYWDQPDPDGPVRLLLLLSRQVVGLVAARSSPRGR